MGGLERRKRTRTSRAAQRRAEQKSRAEEQKRESQ